MRKYQFLTYMHQTQGHASRLKKANGPIALIDPNMVIDGDLNYPTVTNR
jgi:hypothetical protein